MAFMNIQLDGTTYRVRVEYDTYIESFRLVEGINAGDMISNRHERDLSGTASTYEMLVRADPRYPLDFDSFFSTIRSPVDSHLVTVYDGQGLLTYESMIQGGSRILKGTVGGIRRWDVCPVQFVPLAPQWKAQ